MNYVTLLPPDFHFKDPWFMIALLVLIPILYLFYQGLEKKKKADLLFHQNFFNPYKESISILFICISLIALVVCLMEPEGFMKVTEDPILTTTNLNQSLPVLFLLDNSLSMSTPDAPFHKTRFEQAKEIISTLLPKLASTPKSLYTFDDHLQPLIPTTLASSYMNLTLDALSPVPSQHGTDFLQILKELQDYLATPNAIKPRQVIILSDGEDTNPYPDMSAIESIVAALATQGVTFTTIGIGTEKGAPIPNILYHKKPVISHLDQKMLTSISEAGKGNYYNPENISVINLSKNLATTIDQNTYQTLYTSQPQVSYMPLFPLFLGIALVFFLKGFES